MRYLSITMILVCASPVFADTFHVPDDIATLPEINAATNGGDLVIVAPGNYVIPDPLGLNFGGALIQSSGGRSVTTIILEGNAAIVGSIFIKGFTISGGSFRTGGTITIRECTFLGCPVSLSASGALIEDCTFRLSPSVAVSTRANGGNGAPTETLFNRCVFRHNTGGAIDFAASFNAPVEHHLQIRNCVFDDNASTQGGTVLRSIFTNGQPPRTTFDNCTIWGNSSPISSLIDSNATQIRLNNCVVWGNTWPLIKGSLGNITMVFSDIQSGYVGVGNIDTNPLFTDAASGDFTLQAISPCINTGENTFVPSPQGADLYLCTRIVNGTVDMGAFESGPCDAPPWVDPQLGDLNQDGVLDVQDLDILIALMQTCRGDSNVDKAVNVTDLLQLLGAWGPCP